MQGKYDLYNFLTAMNRTCHSLSPVLMQAPGLATTRAEAESQQNAPELNAKLLNETRDAGGRRVNAPPTGLPTPDPNLEVSARATVLQRYKPANFFMLMRKPHCHSKQIRNEISRSKNAASPKA